MSTYPRVRSQVHIQPLALPACRSTRMRTGSAVIAAFFLADKPKAREQERQKVENWIAVGLTPDWGKLKARGASIEHFYDY